MAKNCKYIKNDLNLACNCPYIKDQNLKGVVWLSLCLIVGVVGLIIVL